MIVSIRSTAPNRIFFYLIERRILFILPIRKQIYQFDLFGILYSSERVGKPELSVNSIELTTLGKGILRFK